MSGSGIYKIQSICKPERAYIGSAVDIPQRWRQHLYDLRHNKHANKKLQNYFNKYGETDLVFIIIEPCLPEFLTIREQYYIKTLKPWFNIRKIAESNLGLKNSAESKRKNREKHLGKPSPMKGKHHSEESCKLMSKSREGKPSNNKGKKWNEESRLKMIGNKNGEGSRSEEFKQKMKGKNIWSIGNKYALKKAS